MARTKRRTEEEFYDIFSGWDLADQAVALRVMEQIHRQQKRGKLEPAKQGVAWPKITAIEEEAQS